MAERISKGYYQIQHLYITSHSNKRYDFDGNFDALTYEESIFDLGVAHGHVLFKDSSEICKKLPIVGGERLVFEYKIGSETKTVKKNFIIYKTTTSSDAASMRNIVTLHFITEEMMNSNKKSINRAYKDKTAKQIVEDLFKEVNDTTGSKIKISDTKGQHHIIIPKCHPLEAINKVAAVTQHPSYKSGLYFFFENSHGFNFSCVEEMMAKKPLGTFQKNLQTVDTGVREKTNSLLDLVPLSGAPELLTAMKNGMLGSKYVCYDPLVKSYKEVTYDYNKNFKDTSSMNNFKLVPNADKISNPEQKITYVPSNSIRKKSSYFNNNAGSVSHCNDIEEVCHYSNSMMEQLFSKHYRISVKGDDVSSLWEKKSRMMTIGETIEINYVSKSIDEKETNTPHGYINGKYLVYWCEHVFSMSKYMINAKIISDTNTEDHPTKRRSV
jgi:hypothetical protein